MRSEVLLYVYGMICLGMIGFNLVYHMVLRRRERGAGFRSRGLLRRVVRQAERLRAGMQVEKRHLRYLRRSLSNVNALVALDRVLTHELEPCDAERYVRAIQPVLLELAILYRKKEAVQCAYFAYFAARHQPAGLLMLESMQEVFVTYLGLDSLYCHVNALQALYASGTAESVVRAVALQSRTGAVMNDKILTDGLLSFAGDHRRLEVLLWERFERFDVRTQLAVLNYTRFRTGEWRERIFSIMTDAGRDKELRLSAIRYFGRYVYEPARKWLLDFLADRDPLLWEYAAVSAAGLAQYAGGDVVRALIGALHSGNWYVRYNAAVSLEAHQVAYSDLSELLDGSDRYAREMILYRVESRLMDQEAAREVSGI